MKSTASTTAPALSAADRDAHAASSYVRPFLSPSGAAALARLESATDGWFPAADGDHPSQEDEALRRVRETGNALRAGMAECRDWARTAA